MTEKKYKKITVNLEDDLYRKFKVRLAEKDEKMKKKACLAKICSLLPLALVPAFAEFDDDILIQ